MKLKLMRVRENAVLPKQATAGSAGYDLCACIEEPQTIAPGARAVFPSGLAAEIPAGTAGFIFTRSGLGIKKGIHVTNGVGVIDSDYRGEIHVGLHNLSVEPYTVQPGERIAQMIIMPYFAPEIVEVASLSDTERGAGGFGSTGK
ncbi:dUTP diphosphatase [Anaeromassilibacillus senegalensis]|uniref:Deoxyuridine 5'-triphosphate nucleotidohydrolase n=1 Tax=Anaeromassilibacillus senegalensis TaxID=1673717 RepID=A0ABS9CRD8_9FIRM|nr:dUTP diphosphatase [Anaeromassilibacillus senegalensis]MCF2652534.1 dUTP diphosphatase [Anaeromassilibacillus senegalensis]